jgi:rhodanese-related sulfurtransferase
MEAVSRKISFEEAHRKLEAAERFVILDVRTEEEFITGHAEGAQLLPHFAITAERAADVIPTKDTLVLVYCRSGRRSHQAVETLLSLGYENTYDMGSLVGWPYGMAW